MYQHACSIGLEGVVSKVRDSKDVSGRSNDRLKATCAQRETQPIAGFAIKNNEFDGIYVGRQKGKSLVYAGKVDHGFDKASVKELQSRLKPLIRRTQPYAKKITHRGLWVEPSLLAEIEYRAKSAEGKVRPAPYPGSNHYIHAAAVFLGGCALGCDRNIYLLNNAIAMLDVQLLPWERSKRWAKRLRKADLSAPKHRR
jgi:ATP-dependent DNA ligase